MKLLQTTLPLFLLIATFISSTCSKEHQPWPQPQCTWKPDPGPCRAFFRRYYYNNDTRACDVFVHGGCDGCVPFRTNQQCEAAHCDLVNDIKQIPLPAKSAMTDPDTQLFIMDANTIIE